MSRNFTSPTRRDATRQFHRVGEALPASHKATAKQEFGDNKITDPLVGQLAEFPRSRFKSRFRQ